MQISFYLNAVKPRTKTVPHIPMYSFGITLIALLFGGFRPFCTIFFASSFGDYSIFLHTPYFDPYFFGNGRVTVTSVPLFNSLEIRILP